MIDLNPRPWCNEAAQCLVILSQIFIDYLRYIDSYNLFYIFMWVGVVYEYNMPHCSLSEFVYA